MDDPNETRKIARDWREYLSETKQSFGIYAWAWREFVTPTSRRWMRYGVSALICKSALDMALLWCMKLGVDILLASGFRATIPMLASMGVAAVLSRACNWMFERCREYSLGEDQGRLDVRSTELFLGKSLGQHLADTGLLNAPNMEKGRNRVLEVEHMLIFEGIPTLIDLAFTFALLWLTSAVGGISMLLLLCAYLAFMVFINRRVLAVCLPIDLELRRFNRYRIERCEQAEHVKTCGKEAEEIRHMTAWFTQIIGPDRTFWLWAIRLYNARGLLADLVVWALVVYAFAQVAEGAWTIGLLFPFYQWSKRFADNLWKIGHIEHKLNWNMPPVAALRDALTMPPTIFDVPGAVALVPDQPVRVEFRGLGHSYAKERSRTTVAEGLHVLKGVNFSIETGERVALIGPSGAGKTTIMRLLMRYMDPEEGTVLVDGRDLRDVALASWQRIFGYIPQQAQVFDGSIRYNMLYGLPATEREAVSDEQLWRIMRKLQIDFGERLTEGLETVVGRRGIKLSGGQVQRLATGAAVMKRPRFMIIDEATSSLDSTTEKAVQEGLADPEVLPAGTSALIITHRLSTVRDLCTKFVVLRNAEDAVPGKGQVEAIAGSFEELYPISPTFRRLADDQGIVMRRPFVASA